MKVSIRQIRRYSLPAWTRFFLARAGIGRGIPKKIRAELPRLEGSLKDHVSTAAFPYHTAQACTALSAQERAAILKGAEFTLQNRTNLLCQGEYALGSTVAWQVDFVTGVQMPATKAETARTKSDIKRIWDLSRLYQLMPLCKAFALTGDSVYSEGIRNVIDSWYAGCYRGENALWSNPMEIAIRGVNLIHAITYLESVGAATERFRQQVNAILLRSGFEIRYNLENAALTVNNHYISDLVGLAAIGIYFSASGHAVFGKWVSFAVKRLAREAKRQVYADGVSYEQSTGYHAFVLELFAFTQGLLQENGFSVPEEIRRAVKGMAVFVRSIAEKAEIPLIGDNDNSKLLRTSHFYPFEQPADVRMLLQWVQELTGGLPEEDRTVFPDGGYYILKNEKVKLLFNSGSLSCNGTGGHSHNDQLAFVLWYQGIPVTGDPGTQCYTADIEKRNQSRSTAWHSTVSVEAAEQNAFGRCFEMEEETFSRTDRVTPVSIRAHHVGFQKKCGAVHHREVTLLENGVHVWDALEGYEGAAWSHLILPPGFEATAPGSFSGKGVCITLEAETADFTVDRIDYSRSYGAWESAIRISIPFRRELRYTIILSEDKAGEQYDHSHF